MTRKTLVSVLLTLCLPCVTASIHAADLNIPATKIAALEATAEKAGQAKPRSSRQRRGYKRVVRTGRSLVRAHPGAPNRFEVLGVMLKCQKTVVALEKNDRNRKTLYSICTELVQAPDEWAKVRLEADVLLSERDLAAKGATLEEWGVALDALIKRYRGTVAEPKSLMVCALIAKNMGYESLLRTIEMIMDERCADVPEVIAFRRSVLSLKSFKVKCRGRYKRADGAYLYVPGDRIGHQCVLVYWSKNNKSSERFLKEVEAERKRFDGMFDVYSFNLDELPDAGRQYLRDKGLNWHAMHLPDGKRNVYFQAYGGSNPVALFVNAFGYTVLNPFGVNVDSQGWRSVNSGVYKISASRVSHARYLAQLQSFFIGDFLVADTEGAFDPSMPPEMLMGTPSGQKVKPMARLAGSIPQATLRSIQKAFVPAPFRYRLSRKDATDMYRRIAELCGHALKQHPEAPDAWIIRNRRIVALLGLWNLQMEFPAFEQAVKDAHAVLSSKAPPAAKVVAHFCLARESIRRELPLPEKRIETMITECGGEEAPMSAFAAAAVLSLEANRRDAHEAYRRKVLASKGPHPMWATRTFLRNRYQRFHLLRPNTTRADRMRGSRGVIVNHQWDADAPRMPTCVLRNLDGSDLVLPDDTKERLTLTLFIEPPADPSADFPVRLDREGRPTKNDLIRRVVADAMRMAELHLLKEVDVILAFLTDDVEQVNMLMKQNEWTCRAALVPGGLNAPVVQTLGILSADKLPNVFLLRRDGTVAWRNSGYVYKSEFGFPFAVLLAMKVHIEVSDLIVGCDALRKKDYRQATRYFSNSFALARPDRFGWHSPRYHAHAVARMGVEDWQGALASIEKAHDAHKLRHARGYRRSKNINHWRKDAAIVPIKDPCDIFKELWTTKAIILEKLGRNDDAARVRQLAKTATAEDHESLYSIFHHRMRTYRETVLKLK